MNILWVTQVSSKDKNGKVKINSDSSLDLINGFLTSDMSKNYIIIAFEFAYGDLDESGRNYLQEMRKRNKNIDFVFNKAHHFTDAKTERFFMDYSFFDGIRKHVKQIDVVMLNEPTKALAIKSVFKDAIKMLKIRIQPNKLSEEGIVVKYKAEWIEKQLEKMS